jgi:uncharacterized protein (TIGR02757 family)
MKLNASELKEFLDEKHALYNRPEFIKSDPISIPRKFTGKEDIEIAGFLAATIAWGQRPTITRNAEDLMARMDNAPYDFVKNARRQDLNRLKGFVHRTFNESDLLYFISALKNIYTEHGGMEKAFDPGKGTNEKALRSILNFRKLFFELPYPARTAKHVSDPSANSAAKRLCMYLRWMVRFDERGVDLGTWKKNRLIMADLMCPLDVHSGNVARKLGLLQRSQNDWKAVIELTESLRKLDPEDPVKYDIALFGLGVFEKF